MFKMYYGGYNALGCRSNIASCWARRPLWWDYEGTNFVDRGSNMLHQAEFKIDSADLRGMFDIDPFIDTPFREVMNEGIYSIDSVQLIPVMFTVDECFNTYLPYDPCNTTGKNRHAEVAGTAMIAFVHGRTESIVPYIVLGVFVGGVSDLDALDNFMDNVLVKANQNGFVNRLDYDEWVVRNTGANTDFGEVLLKNRKCPRMENDEYYGGTYYTGGKDGSINNFPPNYVEVEPGKYKFVGSNEPLIRDEDGTVMTVEEYDARDKEVSPEAEAPISEPPVLIEPSDPRFEEMLAKAIH